MLGDQEAISHLKEKIYIWLSPCKCEIFKKQKLHKI